MKTYNNQYLTTFKFLSHLVGRENHNKIIKFVGIFYRIGYKLNFEISKMIHYEFIHSHLIYGIAMY